MKSATKKNIEIAGGVATGLAALAAGAIFLYGKDGASRRKQVKGVLQMVAELKGHYKNIQKSLNKKPPAVAKAMAGKAKK
ncbi:MAG: hypothetical protein O3A36_02285 [bacterium]|nr:hypothetical protein [bacterium]